MTLSPKFASAGITFAASGIQDPRILPATGAPPARSAIASNSFELGASGWLHNVRPHPQGAAAFDIGMVPSPANPSEDVLRLAARAVRPFDGPEEFHEIHQSIAFEAGKPPMLLGEYFATGEEQSAFGGFYIRTTLYAGRERVLDVLLHNGGKEERAHLLPSIFLAPDFVSNDHTAIYRERCSSGRFMHYRITDTFELWHRFRVNFGELASQRRRDMPPQVDLSKADRMLVAAGVWCGGERDSRASVLFRDLSTHTGQTESFFGDMTAEVGFMNFQPVYAIPVSGLA